MTVKPSATSPISTVPCPFCGSTFAAKVEVKGGFRLRCVCCDAQTGSGTTDDVLKGYWERRPFAVSAVAGVTFEKALGAAMADALQGDFEGCAELARMVKIEMVDGEPVVRGFRLSARPKCWRCGNPMAENRPFCPNSGIAAPCDSSGPPVPPKHRPVA